MALDKKISDEIISPFFSHPGFHTDEVSIRVVESVRETRYGYEITSERLIFTVPKDQDFVRNLKRGDRVVTVMEGMKTKLLYGPLNEENLYVNKG